MPSELRAHVDLPDCSISEFQSYLFSTGEQPPVAESECDRAWWLLDEYAINDFATCSVAPARAPAPPVVQQPATTGPWRQRELNFDGAGAPSTVRSYLGFGDVVRVIEYRRVTVHGNNSDALSIEIVLEEQGSLAAMLAVSGIMVVQSTSSRALLVELVLTVTITANFFVRGMLETGVSVKGVSRLTRWADDAPEAAEAVLGRARAAAVRAQAASAAAATTSALALAAGPSALERAASEPSTVYLSAGDAGDVGIWTSNDREFFVDACEADPSPERALLAVISEYTYSIARSLTAIDSKLAELSRRQAARSQRARAPPPSQTPQVRRQTQRSQSQPQPQPAGRWLSWKTLTLVAAVAGAGLLAVRLVRRMRGNRGLGVGPGDAPVMIV